MVRPKATKAPALPSDPFRLQERNVDPVHLRRNRPQNLTPKEKKLQKFKDPRASEASFWFIVVGQNFELLGCFFWRRFQMWLRVLRAQRAT